MEGISNFLDITPEMKFVLDKFENAKNVSSDINEHIGTLRSLSSSCSSVLELGTRRAVSTWAFLAGLSDGDATGTKHLVCVDLEYDNAIEEVAEAALGIGVAFEFARGNDLKLDIGKHTLFAGPVDLTFIDTWHVYGQLRRELEKFAPLTRKYIVMHDTEVDAIRGESIRCNWNTAEQAERSGFPETEIRRGLRPAVEEFLEENAGVWRMKVHYSNNNGLTVLERISGFTPE